MTTNTESTVTTTSDMRWSIGLGHEVRIVETCGGDTFMVTYGDEEFSSEAARSDLLPPFRPGTVVYAPSGQMTVVTSRSTAGVYVWRAGDREQDGDFFIPWRDMRSASEPDLSENSTARYMASLYAAFTERQEAVIRQSDRVSEAQQQLDAFKDEVCKAARRAGRSHDWCREGINEVLAEIGLELVPPRYRVRVEFSVDVEINADSSEEAEARARYLIDGAEWSGQRDGEEVEMTLVEDSKIATSTEEITEE